MRYHIRCDNHRSTVHEGRFLEVLYILSGDVTT